MNKPKKMFSLNTDDISEWVIAEDKRQAITFADSAWGGIIQIDYWDEYKEDNPKAKFDDFIEYFVKEEPPEKELMIDGEITTVRKILDSADEIPSWYSRALG